MVNRWQHDPRKICDLQGIDEDTGDFFPLLLDWRQIKHYNILRQQAVQEGSNLGFRSCFCFWLGMKQNSQAYSSQSTNLICLYVKRSYQESFIILK